jgi:hypothetical protein
MTTECHRLKGGNMFTRRQITTTKLYQYISFFLSIEVLTAVKLTAVLRLVRPCGLVGWCQHFGDTYGIHLQDSSICLQIHTALLPTRPTSTFTYILGLFLYTECRKPTSHDVSPYQTDASRINHPLKSTFHYWKPNFYACISLFCMKPQQRSWVLDVLG